MLATVIESWIRHLPERGFDAPFQELLRAQGFYEFGKDFIAKRDEPQPAQYAFQSKAGDIGGREWSDMRGQLEELADAEATHPSYDAHLPKNSSW